MRGMAMESSRITENSEENLPWYLLEADSTPDLIVDEQRLVNLHDISKEFKESEHKVLAASILQYAIESIYLDISNNKDLKDKVEEEVQLSVVSVESNIDLFDNFKTDLTIEDIQNLIDLDLKKTAYEPINAPNRNYSPVALSNLDIIWRKYKELYKGDHIVEKSEQLSWLAMWQIIHNEITSAVAKKSTE